MPELLKLSKKQWLCSSGTVWLAATALTVSAGLALSNDALWRTAKYMMTLLPVCWVLTLYRQATNNPRLAETPRHRLMVGAAIYGLLIGAALAALLYAAGWAYGLEPNGDRLVSIVVDGLFLSALGVTASNLFKNTAAGYVTAVVYGALCMWGGAALAEGMWFVSLSANLDIYAKMPWDNLVYLTALAVVLLACNIAYTGRSEEAHRFTLCGMAMAVVVIMFINIPAVSGIEREAVKTVSEEGYTLHYNSEIPEPKAQELLRQWRLIQEACTPYLEHPVREALYTREHTAPTDEGLVFTYRYLEDLNPPRRCRREDSVTSITSAILDNAGLRALDKPLREGWCKYMLHAAVYPAVAGKLQDCPASFQADACNRYLEHILQQQTPVDKAAYQLYYIDTKYGAASVKGILTDIASGNCRPETAIARHADGDTAGLLHELHLNVS